MIRAAETTEQGREGSVTGEGLALEGFLGGTPLPGFVLGAGAFGASIPSASEEKPTLPPYTANQETLIAMFGPFAQYYFSPRAGGYVQMFGGYTIEALGMHRVEGEFTGYVLGAGGGWDFWTATQQSVGPAFRLSYARLRDDYSTAQGLWLLSVSGAATFH